MSVGRKERKLLLLVGFILFTFALCDNIKVAADRYNQEVEEKQRALSNRANGEISWGIYVFGRPDYRPIARFVALLVFPFLYWSRKFLVSLLLSFLSFLIFGFELFWGTRAVLNDEFYSRKGFVDQLFAVLTPLDYLVFLLIALLLVSQILFKIRPLRRIEQLRQTHK